MKARRWPGLFLLMVAALLLAAAACVGVLALAVHPPFLMWQHGAALHDPLNAYIQAEFPPGYAAHITWVKEYTGTCAVVQASIGGADRPALIYWALLGRDDETWEVVYLETAGGRVPLLSLARVCDPEGAPLIPDINLEPLQ